MTYLLAPPLGGGYVVANPPDGAADLAFIEYEGKRFQLPAGEALLGADAACHLRLEYGYNLNPRPRDPRGTLLLSIGFPF